ncbi:biotin transporter BioY [Chloroflexota bacterium]
MYARTTTFDRTNTLAREVLVIALFAALTALGAQVAIRLPFSPVPVTLQVLVVAGSGLALGARRGLMSQLAYLTAGALGLPVFAGGTGGLAVILGPTGGYLMAFPVAALAAGQLSETLERNGWVAATVASLVALAIIYGGGVLWLAVWLRGTGVPSFAPAIAEAWHLGVKPFIMLDLAKVLLAASAVGSSRAVLNRWFGEGA